MARKAEPLVSRHHIFFERAWYRKQYEREFRCHRGLIIPMPHLEHKALHADVEAPPKPLPYQIREATKVLDSVPYKERDMPLWGVLAVKDYFDREADHHGLKESGVRARQVCENIERQLGYLALGVERAAELIAA